MWGKVCGKYQIVRTVLAIGRLVLLMMLLLTDSHPAVNIPVPWRALSSPRRLSGQIVEVPMSRWGPPEDLDR